MPKIAQVSLKPVVPDFYATLQSTENDQFTLGFSADMESAKNIL